MINKIAPKKFKVRVAHFASATYCVQWCNYRFIPIWHSLCFWFDQGHPGGTEQWSTNLFSYKKAEKVAAKITSIEDVRKYYLRDEKKEEKWKLKETAYWAKNAPYISKEININKQ